MNLTELVDQAPTVLASVGGFGAVLVGVVSWLSKRQLERALIQLKANNDRELEVIKTRLNVESSILQAKYNRLNERRLDAIANSASLLAQAWIHCGNAIQPDELGRERPSPGARLHMAAAAMDAFFANFESTRIFLPRDTADRAYAFIYRMQKALDELRIHASSPDNYEAGLNRLYSAWLSDLKPSLTAARELLEEEYRTLLGVEA